MEFGQYEAVSASFWARQASGVLQVPMVQNIILPQIGLAQEMSFEHVMKGGNDVLKPHEGGQR